jgi:succinate dehydrogenase membrane anchor subunit
MDYITDRKRAVGHGAAKSGTQKHWAMQVSAVALAILVPLFVFTFGSALGGSYEEVVAYYSRPFPAIVAALTMIVGFIHFKNGATTAIEDYARGSSRKLLILLVTFVAYTAMATVLFALARLAL